VQRLSIQEHDWQLAKEEAINTRDFESAARLKDSQEKLRKRLDSLISELLEGSE